MNKKIKLLITLLIASFPTMVYAATEPTTAVAHVGDNFCSDTANTLKFVGYVLLFLKVLVPLMIIFMGSFDFVKAITDGKDETLKKQFGILGKRIVAGIIIFFIPTLINVLLGTLNKWNVIKGDYEECATCLISPYKCDK